MLAPVSGGAIINCKCASSSPRKIIIAPQNYHLKTVRVAVESTAKEAVELHKYLASITRQRFCMMLKQFEILLLVVGTRSRTSSAPV
jgi:hypothetical protein